jgi:hypothetical protein
MATAHKDITTDEQIDQAIFSAARSPEEPRALSIEYRPSLDIFILKLSNGERLILQRELLEGLQIATRRQLTNVEITPQGTGLHWPDLDADLYVPNLRRHVYGTKQWMSQIGKVGGAVKSPAKRKASRINGRSGGRPTKTVSR